jgi:type II secretory pathway pseudopilin PulG
MQTDQFELIWRLNFGENINRSLNLEKVVQQESKNETKIQSNEEDKIAPSVESTELKSFETEDKKEIVASNKKQRKSKKKQQQQQQQQEQEQQEQQEQQQQQSQKQSQKQKQTKQQKQQSKIPTTVPADLSPPLPSPQSQLQSSQSAESPKSSFAWNIPSFISAQPVISFLKNQEEVRQSLSFPFFFFLFLSGPIFQILFLPENVNYSRPCCDSFRK